MPAPKILIVDDEPGIRSLVAAYLRQEQYTVYEAEDGPAALKAARAFRPDLIVLDLMLPGIDGIEVLTQLRRESDVYVIMLTARSEETDKVVGLTVGADDYVTKPFSPRELTARIKAALRRLRSAAAAQPEVIAFRRIVLNLSAREAAVDDRPLDLTPIEFDLLRVLAEHRNMVLSREQLVEKVWGYDYYGDARTVDVHIGHLRAKMGVDLIATVRGAGYRLVDDPL